MTKMRTKTKEVPSALWQMKFPLVLIQQISLQECNLIRNMVRYVAPEWESNR